MNTSMIITRHESRHLELREAVHTNLYMVNINIIFPYGQTDKVVLYLPPNVICLKLFLLISAVL